MAEGVLGTPDMLRLVLSLLPSAHDILNLGLTCRKLSSLILNNVKVWRLFVEKKFPDVPTLNIKDDDISWIGLAFAPSGKAVETRLRLFHLNKRLTAEPQSKDFLRFFLSIVTTREASETEKAFRSECILQASSDGPEAGNGMLTIKFVHAKLPSVLFWFGECNIRSEVIVYAVDRRVIGGKIVFERGSYDFRKTATILGKSQYKEVGRIAREDENYYISGEASSSSYNYSTDHSGFRAMSSSESKYGFGSSTKNTERPRVAVEAWTQTLVSFNLDILFKMFCIRKG